MVRTSRKINRHCWCGNQSLSDFSKDYRLCSECGTLVSQAGLPNNDYLVHDDESDFYGRNYWLNHQPNDLGLPQIDERARLDLPERCIHWLRQILTFRLPPASVLEVGASHGAFVALMRWAGFDATGLELSPWVADYARRTFDVPMLLGPLERQGLGQGTYDVIVANDVMEHLPDPVTTIETAVKLIKPDGILVLQMPDFVEGKSYTQRVAAHERFLEHTTKPAEHLYLYSKRAIRLLLARAGLEHVEFRPAIFDYDMYLVASRQNLQAKPTSEIHAALQKYPQSRSVLALLDKGEAFDKLNASWRQSESDRSDRLQVMTRLGEQLAESEADRAARLNAVMVLTRNLTDCQEDRSTCIQVIKQQEKVIRDCQDAMQAMRWAFGLEPYPPLRLRLGKGCNRFARTVARLLLPETWRRRLRNVVPAEVEASKNRDAGHLTPALRRDG